LNCARRMRAVIGRRCQERRTEARVLVQMWKLPLEFDR
jgi:hypothetical protein